MAGVGLTGKIEPLNGGAFPVFEDINGQGGLRAVADVTARDAIPANSRKIGMVVVTQDDGVQYQLVDGILNADWQEVTAALNNLSNAYYIDKNSVASSSNGSIAAPFKTIAAALTAAASNASGIVSFIITPGDYTGATLDLPAKNLVFWGLGSNVNGFSGGVDLPDMNCLNPQIVSFRYVNAGVVTDLGTGGPSYVDFQYANGQAVIGRTANDTVVTVVGSSSLDAIGSISEVSALNRLTMTGGSYGGFGFSSLVLNLLRLTNASFRSNSLVQGTGSNPSVFAIGTTFSSPVNFLSFFSATMDEASYASFIAAGCSINCPVTILSAQATSSTQTGSGAATLNWAQSQNITLTLTGNTTATFTAPGYRPAQLILWVVQGGAGTYTLTLPSACRTPSGSATAAAITTGVGARDRLVFDYNGTNYYWTADRNFLP